MGGSQGRASPCPGNGHFPIVESGSTGGVGRDSVALSRGQVEGRERKEAGGQGSRGKWGTKGGCCRRLGLLQGWEVQPPQGGAVAQEEVALFG